MWILGPYEIKQLDRGSERRQACQFSNTMYRQAGYLERDSAHFPDHFFAVYKGGQIRATIGAYLHGEFEGCAFPTERAFDFSVTELGLDPNRVGEVARFSGDGSMFVPIISWMARFMYTEMGLTHAMFGVKHTLERYLGKMGVASIVHPIGRMPVLDTIPPEFHKYFSEPPPVVVATVDLAEAQPVVEAHLHRVIDG